MIDATYEAKLARTRELIAQRDQIDAELCELLGGEAKRGRPRKPRETKTPSEPTAA